MPCFTRCIAGGMTVSQVVAHVKESQPEMDDAGEGASLLTEVAKVSKMLFREGLSNSKCLILL